jgi:hypothetical protein
LNGSAPKSRGKRRGEWAGVILGVEIGDEEYVGEGGAVELGDVGRDFLTRWLMKSSSM